MLGRARAGVVERRRERVVVRRVVFILEREGGLLMCWFLCGGWLVGCGARMIGWLAWMVGCGAQIVGCGA